MKKFSLFVIFFLFSLTCAFADVYEHKTDFETISKQLPKMDSIKCKFRQEKTLQNLKKPLVSGGNFEFKKGEGVFFDTIYPVKSSVNYTNKNYKQINDVVNSISSKKYSKLEKEFDVYYQTLNIEKNLWCIGLKPKRETTAEYISKITIEGSDYINRIDIAQTNGNRTQIWFTRNDL